MKGPVQTIQLHMLGLTATQLSGGPQVIHTKPQVIRTEVHVYPVQTIQLYTLGLITLVDHTPHWITHQMPNSAEIPRLYILGTRPSSINWCLELHHPNINHFQVVPPNKSSTYVNLGNCISLISRVPSMILGPQTTGKTRQVSQLLITLQDAM